MNRLISFNEYFDHPYNTTIKNERAVELPIACRFIEITGENNIIEIGAVMPYYGYKQHKVLDPFDPYHNSIRIDAENFDYTDKNIISISTLEHMGDLEFSKILNNKPDFLKPVRVFQKILKQAKSFFISYPVGYTGFQIGRHPLDDFFLNSLNRTNYFDLFGYVKTEQNPPRWFYIPKIDKEFFDGQYNDPFPNGNNILFVLGGLNS
jgi:hypothetical protein